MLASEMKGEPNLVTGQLENGFRYVILPNKLPPKRFEAHLEVHVGSVDELPNEQVHGRAWAQQHALCRDGWPACANAASTSLCVGATYSHSRQGTQRRSGYPAYRCS
jgi:hypothetical protein